MTNENIPIYYILEYNTLNLLGLFFLGNCWCWYSWETNSRGYEITPRCRLISFLFWLPCLLTQIGFQAGLRAKKAEEQALLNQMELAKLEGNLFIFLFCFYKFLRSNAWLNNCCLITFWGSMILTILFFIWLLFFFDSLLFVRVADCFALFLNRLLITFQIIISKFFASSMSFRHTEELYVRFC